MKIPVFTIVSVKPQTENEQEDICDILNLPSLKYGTAEFIGELNHFISMSELKAKSKVSARYFDRNSKSWLNGVLLLDSDKKYFAHTN